jgi:hypothetical protein
MATKMLCLFLAAKAQLSTGSDRFSIAKSVSSAFVDAVDDQFPLFIVNRLLMNTLWKLSI